jgi:hypothetical protein
MAESIADSEQEKVERLRKGAIGIPEIGVAELVSLRWVAREVVDFEGPFGTGELETVERLLRASDIKELERLVREKTTGELEKLLWTPTKAKYGRYLWRTEHAADFLGLSEIKYLNGVTYADVEGDVAPYVWMLSKSTF